MVEEKMHQKKKEGIKNKESLKERKMRQKK